MSEQDKKAAKEHAERAGRQLKHAASNLVDAAEHTGEHAKDEVREGAEKVVDVAQGVDYSRFAKGLDKAATGLLALSAVLYVATKSSKRFREAFLDGAEVVSGEVTP